MSEAEQKGPKLPIQMIRVLYKNDHDDKGIRRTIFVYEGEDVNLYLSKAWRTTAVKATISNIIAKAETDLKPSRVAGEWENI